MRKERIAELELIRSFAFLAVVYQHVIGIYMRVPGIDQQTAMVYGMWFHLLKFAVPAFVFITGLVLFYNYYEKIAYLSFMRKRITEILLPYLVWSVVYLLLSPDFQKGGDGGGVWNLSKTILTGTASYHLWFVVMIFQFYLFYPWWQQVFRFLRRQAKTLLRFIIIAAGVSLVYGVMMWFSHRYIPAHGFSFHNVWLDTYFIKYRDRNALYYFFYFLLGGMVAVLLTVFRAKIKQYWTWICISFALLYGYVGYELIRDSGSGLVNLNVATSLKPSMFLYTVAQLLLIYGLALWLLRNQRLSAMLTRIGQYSYGAYLIHALVLTYVMQGLRALQWFHEGILGSLVAFVLCSLLSFAVSYGLSKLPWGWLLVGAAKKKRANPPAAQPSRKAAV